MESENMGKMGAVVIAASALAAGVRAGCPANTFLCGSESTDVLRCECSFPVFMPSVTRKNAKVPA